MKIELDKGEVELLLHGMETVIKIASRARWPLARVQPFIDLMQNIDRQTMKERFGNETRMP